MYGIAEIRDFYQPVHKTSNFSKNLNQVSWPKQSLIIAESI